MRLCLGMGPAFLQSPRLGQLWGCECRRKASAPDSEKPRQRSRTPGLLPFFEEFVLGIMVQATRGVVSVS